MVREDILAGLRQAIFLGESLRTAMVSFYNAGYSKEEIEEAARLIKDEQIQKKPAPVFSELKENKIPIQNVSQYVSQSPTIIQPKPIQNFSEENSKKQISDYSYERKKSRLGWIILISGSLVILILAILMIIFRESITEFLNNLFG